MTQKVEVTENVSKYFYNLQLQYFRISKQICCNMIIAFIHRNHNYLQIAILKMNLTYHNSSTKLEQLSQYTNNDENYFLQYQSNFCNYDDKVKT